MSTFFRNVPSLNEILDSPPLKQIIDTANRQSVVVGAKKFLSGLEAEVRSTAASVPIPNVRDLAGQIARWISEGQPPRPYPTINATGDLLHPHLGSPPLAKEAIAAMHVASAGYQYRGPTEGKSGDLAAVESLLCQLTGAEAAIVSNSGASALLLALAGASEKGEVLIARGDLAESPKGERISDIAAASHAKLREVGAVNRTTLADYENALASPAAAILSVRWSEQSGRLDLPELGDLARRKSVSLIVDLGSAPIIDLQEFGPTTPAISETVKSHVDLVTFATEGLIGGPPCGVILGKRHFIEALRKLALHAPLAANSIMLAGLLATLEHYKTRSLALERIPVLSLLSTGLANLEFRAQRIAEQLKTHPLLDSVEVVADSAPLTGASGSSQVIPTHCVKILPKNSAKLTMEAHLAAGQSGLLARSHKEYLCIDLRSVFPDQDPRIVEILEAITSDSAV